MWGWLVALMAPLLEKISLDLVKDFISWVSSLWSRHEKEVAQEQQAQQYQKTVDNPSSTPEVKKDAEGNILNS